MNIISKVIRKIKNFGKSAQEIEMEQLIERGLHLGKNVSIFTTYAIDVEWPWLISIGDNTVISTNVKILAHDASTSFLGVGTKIGRVDIGRNVFIGSGTIVLCGVEIGDNSIIGAGSVVTKNIKPNSVYAGNPARYICSTDELREKHSNGLIFNEYAWDEWKFASKQDKESMREKLKDRIGYVGAKRTK